MRPRRSLTGAFAPLFLLLVLVTSTSRAAATTKMPTAVPVTPPRAVGALFSLNSNGTLGKHFCTATVVDSPRGDLILTAAHCLSGRRAESLAFVPRYRNGKAPLGVWTVRRIFVDSAWATSGDPDDDFAFLVVRSASARSTLQALTGAEKLASASSVGKRATVVCYPSSAETAIACANSLLPFSATQIRFDCDGYTNGTSGSAIVVNPDLGSGLGAAVGVIGGYQQGGNTPSVSYAATFGSDARALAHQASQAG